LTSFDGPYHEFAAVWSQMLQEGYHQSITRTCDFVIAVKNKGAAIGS